MEKLFKVCLTVLTICNSFGTERVIVSAERRSSGFTYFVIQQPAYPRDCREVSNACSSTHNTSGVYLTKPDGYPEPFEAYCDNDLDTGGWTVLQRRKSDSVNFNRSWKDFRNGFGFLGSDFWIGNEKIAFLTNQKRYQLRMEFENVAGDTYYVTYDDFRISDEWGDYYISSLGTFVRSDESKIEWCPANEIFSNETCERTCDDPNTCISATSRPETEQCVCVGDYLREQERCIPLNQCNCFVADKGGVLREGEFYANSRCTRRSTCRNNQIIDESYQCSDHAACDERNGVRKCYCNQNYDGNGVTCTHNCFDAAKGSVLGEGEFYVNSRCTRRSTCRNNQIVKAIYQCSDQATCDERNGVRKCYCNQNYQGDGVTCTHNCFVAATRRVLREGESYVNSRCSQRSTCENNQIIEASYICSDHATCGERNGVRKCYCNPNYEGDGTTCTHSCFVAAKRSVLREGEFYVNSRCTQRSTCRNNQIIDESYQCSDHAACDERNGVRKCYCNQNYDGDGVTCSHKCFVAAKGSVLREGELYINSDCSLRITCNRNVLTSQRYSCSAGATCGERNGIRGCYCNEWFEGDGLTCTRSGPRDCSDLYAVGRRNNGKYIIYPAGSSGFEVFCEMSSGGWTILQRRTSSSVSFYRNWYEYKNGFGTPTGDHWIGNDKIYKLTNQKTYQLLVERTNREGSTYHNRYSSFSITNEGDKYRLSLGDFDGNAGNNAMEANSGYRFSTHDEDNDGSSTFDCAEKHRGGWWYPDDSSTGSTSNCYSFSNRVAADGYEYSGCICYYYDYCY
ncbi:uncharacterized protein [Apostichopus japonicus]|uniref:uncharacterized protein n=1 Tax=Stichopus japonicus TaxID=307972 RepID=UPI003AB4100F